MEFEAIKKHLNERVRVELTRGGFVTGLLERARPPAPFAINGIEFMADAVRSISVLDESIFQPEVAALVALPLVMRLRAREDLVARIVDELGRGQVQAESWVEQELHRRNTPTLEKTCVDRLFGFIGFGVDAPKFIFLGAEEALTGSALVNLSARCRSFRFPLHDKDEALDQLADAYDAHGAPDDAVAYRAAHNPGQVPTWKFCAMVTAALRGGCASDADWQLRWQSEYRALGRRVAGADTLLAELYPLPKPGLDKWPPAYAALFGFTSAARYFSRVWPKQVDPLAKPGRRENVRAAIQKGTPSHLIQFSRGSGGEFWDRLDGILDLVDSFGASGARSRWHVVSTNRIEVALARGGTRVARLGFPWGQAAATSVTDLDVGTVVKALQSLRAA